jgi:hypothetical protein
MINLTSRVRDEWIRFEMQVIAKRRVQHPELKAEAREAFIGGAGAMYRIFTEEIGQIGTPELQQKAIHELLEELRAFALEAGRK